MAQRASVNLSDLPEGDHFVKDISNQGTCVVYMKLTEACVKAIDALLAAKKVQCDIRNEIYAKPINVCYKCNIIIKG